MKIDPARIRQLREQRAWSQEQLAEIAGINVRTLQRVESSGGGSLETRMALASALEVTPAELAEPVPGKTAPQADQAVHPPPASPAASQAHAQWPIFTVLLAILFALMLLFGYMFGRDLAQRKNHADDRAAAQQAQEAAQRASEQATEPAPQTRQHDDTRPTTPEASD